MGRRSEARKAISKVVYCVFLFGWVIVLIAFAFWKLRQDVVDYFRYFTNWNWTLQMVYFAVALAVEVSNIKWLRMVNDVFLWPVVNGTTWLVFFLVGLMVWDNADILLHQHYSFRLVMLGSGIYHVLISISILIHAFLHKEYIDDAPSVMVDWASYYKKPKATEEKVHMFTGWQWYSVYYRFGWVGLLPLGVIGLYALLNNIHERYGITTSIGILIPIVVAINLVFNFAYIGLQMIYVRPPTTKFYRDFRWERSCSTAL